MDIPKDVQTHDMPASTIWIKEGIVYSTPKKNVVQKISGEEVKRDMHLFRAVVGPEKVCMVVEINPKSKPAAKEERDLVASEIASVVKAMALITSSHVTRMLANIFFAFKPPPYHVKMFSNEKDATNWIKQYI